MREFVYSCWLQSVGTSLDPMRVDAFQMSVGSVKSIYRRCPCCIYFWVFRPVLSGLDGFDKDPQEGASALW